MRLLPPTGPARIVAIVLYVVVGLVALALIFEFGINRLLPANY